MSSLFVAKEDSSVLPLRALVTALQQTVPGYGVYVTWDKHINTLPRFQILATPEHYRTVIDNILGVGDRVEYLFLNELKAKYVRTKTDEDQCYHYFFTIDTEALEILDTNF